MFELADAVRFDKKMSSGRTTPLLLECELDDGTTVEVIAKFSMGCAVGGLIREALVAMFASDIGLPVPAPYLVQVSPEFIATIPNQDVIALLQGSDQLGFGSQRLPDGYSQWIEPGGRMSSALEQQAIDIMCLDCWTANADRRVSRPNLLTNGRSFAIFDHELALTGPNTLFWNEPWKENALLGANPPQDHVFHKHLRGRALYATDAMKERVAQINDTRIADYVAALPASWIASGTTAQEAQAYIMSLRNNLTAADLELKRALS